VHGYVGQYTTTIRLKDGSREEVGHGVAVVATGAHEMKPKEYLYGQHPGVITQRELEERIHDAQYAVPQSVVMIQCVGSRDDEHPYCSRICCTEAIKNALEIKKRNPQAQVTVLVPRHPLLWLRELAYREAREAGVLFLEYSEKLKPVVTANGTGARVEVVVQPEGQK